MALRDIIRGAKLDIAKSSTLAKLAPLAIAMPSLGVNALSNNAASDQPILKPATANLANTSNPRQLISFILRQDLYVVIVRHCASDYLANTRP